jgi:hypothetical protein
MKLRFGACLSLMLEGCTHEAVYASFNHLDRVEELSSWHCPSYFLGLFDDQVPAGEVDLTAVGTSVLSPQACYPPLWFAFE